MTHPEQEDAVRSALIQNGESAIDTNKRLVAALLSERAKAEKLVSALEKVSMCGCHHLLNEVADEALADWRKESV